MNRTELVLRVRSLTRDFNGSIFRESDIQDYLNEAIERVMQVIPELSGMTLLKNPTDEPIILPTPYHSLLASYSASRCYMQDERHYQSTTFMNEFETKLDEFKLAVENGRIILKDVAGNVIVPFDSEDYVVDNYFNVSAPIDLDDGVEGV